MQHNCQDIIQLFHQTFYQTYQTKLVKGDDEPVYLPANENVTYHQIMFAHGYVSSALHETAHWCLAGEKRRQQVDWGYWYLPDGRNEKQQARFEQVELKPQAIEWAFSLAANIKFNVSADNLSGCGSDWRAFRIKVRAQLLQYFEHGFPVRAQQFIDTLIAFYRPSEKWSKQMFLLEYSEDEKV